MMANHEYEHILVLIERMNTANVIEKGIAEEDLRSYLNSLLMSARNNGIEIGKTRIRENLLEAICDAVKSV